MSRPLPSPEDLITLTQESVRNASGLLKDARVLLAAESAPRAHALAALALEEVGKSHLCILASGLVPVPGGTVYGPAGEGFWKAWRDHPLKLFWVLSQLRLVIGESADPIDEAAARIKDEARAEHLRKMRGFYVDFEDGIVLVPGEITAEEAEQLIANASVVVEVAEAAWCSAGSLERALEVLGRPADLAEMVDRIGQAVMDDPAAAFGTARDIFSEAMRDVLPPVTQASPE